MKTNEKSGSSNERTFRNKLREDYNSLLKNLQPVSKTRDVAEHLINHGTITSMEAIKAYGDTRLSDTIYRLKKHGFNIETNMVSELDRYNRVVEFAQYELKERL